ncbi:MAG: hypothetical protein L3J68_00210 [Thermoplasmata archaeon]|nr:hypothetical protein [Thermoplasmata archaeon]
MDWASFAEGLVAGVLLTTVSGFLVNFLQPLALHYGKKLLPSKPAQKQQVKAEIEREGPKADFDLVESVAKIVGTALQEFVTEMEPFFSAWIQATSGFATGVSAIVVAAEFLSVLLIGEYLGVDVVGLVLGLAASVMVVGAIEVGLAERMFRKAKLGPNPK